MDFGRLIRGVRLASVLCCAMLWPAGALQAATFPEFVDPNPAAGNGFGTNVVALSTGNVVITSPSDDAGGPNAGAVYLFNGSTGALISTLLGSTADDFTGIAVTVLSNGNYVVSSPNWDNGAVVEAGAVTWGSGMTGVSGVVSAANSLVGSAANDNVGSSGVTALSNGNYVVASPNWNSGAVADAGAVTWGSGTSGVSGTISVANSLVGSTTNDLVGDGGAMALSNGNYVVRSVGWDNGAVADAGAVTWGSGATGVSGAVSAANSLVGSTATDIIGSSGALALSNGNYVVLSPNWDSGAVVDAGAATWGSGTTGVSGTVSAANSLVGSAAGDRIGNNGTALSNGNYVVRSIAWRNGAVLGAGAATWGSGTTGVSGAVSAANSLVGSTANNQVGNNGATALSNGNYVVPSSFWNSAAGAVTWGSGTAGVTGVVSAANSLVGSTASDQVGVVTALPNGNYVVASSVWNNGAVADAGAVTWGSGTTGVTGAVSAANSLVGSTANDNVGNLSVAVLANGNFVVRSSLWDNGAAVNAGAVTWGSGTTGVSGAVSAVNSLVGSTAGDLVGAGGVTVLSNGNYVVPISNWDNGAIVNVGAVAWGSGTTGVSGAVSAANSLVGSTASDVIGSDGVTALSNGNYVVRSSTWDNGAIVNAGAATWGSGTTGLTGAVSAANSLVGSTPGDFVSIGGVTALSNGNYVVRSHAWDNGAVVDAGAVTWGRGTAGVSGAVSAANSLVGATASTSLQAVVVDNVNATFFGRFLTEGGGRVRVGQQEPARPSILNIVDVRNDQGRQVRLSFARSGSDVLNSATPIIDYYIYRREIVALSSATRPRVPLSALTPNQALIAGWDYVMTVPATTDDVYQTVVPTLADSNETGFHRTVLFVRAATATPGIYYDSAPDSGWSADNLPPAPPAPFVAAYSGGATHLHWGVNGESDLWHYAVYRGSSAGFIPGPGNRIATPSDTVYADVGPAGRYYKLSAIDVNGNESSFALVTPGGTTGVGGESPVAFALDGVRPNPTSGSGLNVALALPTGASARLELLDVGGRRVLAREVGSLGVGRHTVNLAEGRRVAPGLYWVRLTQGANRRTTRVAVVE